MGSVKTDTLKLPGVNLYYEIRGSGPLLLLISGGLMDAGLFAGIADALADSYTVITYDRRGSSRSKLDDPSQLRSVEAHGEDAHRLLATIDPSPALVFANCAGALIGLDLITRHPQQVERLIAHEPPAFWLLPDGGRLRALMREVHQRARTEGVGAAMRRFTVGLGMEAGQPPTEVSPDIVEAMVRVEANMKYFLAREILPYSSYEPDAAAIRAQSARIRAAAGRDSAGQVPHRGAIALAELLGSPPVYFPGEHGGFITHPTEFAETLRSALGG